MKVRVSIINYSNTIPFVYGLHSHAELQKISTFVYHYPSQGVEMLNNNEVDISIVPIAAIPEIENAHIISNFCISSHKQVDSVCLFSHVPLHEIQHITLDYQSRSSNMLTQILATYVWNISPKYSLGKPGYENVQDNSAKVIIGDRAMCMKTNYEYVYDLCFEWHQAFQLPFVFACWVANKPIAPEYLQQFEQALSYGVSHIDQAIANTGKEFEFDIHSYLHHRIEYELSDEKRKAMKLFYEKSKLI